MVYINAHLTNLIIKTTRNDNYKGDFMSVNMDKAAKLEVVENTDSRPEVKAKSKVVTSASNRFHIPELKHRNFRGGEFWQKVPAWAGVKKKILGITFGS